jgi:pyridinium-3,5-bisthiocarboxylic acid mononucleotide nickel chelatase
VTDLARHAWVDASAGVAGDMLLGALVDAGADLGIVQRTIDAVIPAAVRVSGTAVTRAGLRATKANVEVLVADPPHRTWRTIRDLLTVADIPMQVREKALAVFSRLAAAEAHVHGISAGDVHFHEVGALDSIADVVGVCAGLHDLGIARVTAGEVAVGSGRVKIAHGDIPVPVPAVAELARGWRVRAGGTGELATPTGMALVTELAAECVELPPLSILRIGVGAGTRDTPGTPNVTRVILGQPYQQDAGGEGDVMVILETNVDDLDPQLWPGVLTALLAAGAADTWLTPILMKKGRPAHTLSVLGRPEQALALRDLIFRQTSTIGIRQNTVRRHALPRMFVAVEVAGGSVAIKIAHSGGVIVRATPEFDDVAAAAAAVSLPAGAVLQEAIAAAWNAGLRPGAPVPVPGV